jgi:hypothetical protein
MSGPHVKGSALIPGYKYLLKHYGKKGLEKIASQMDPKDAKVILERILAGKWYPYRAFVGLLRATDDTFGKGDNSFISDLSSLGAKEGMSTIYKFFMRLGKPGMTLEKMGTMWHLNFDSGRLEGLKNEKGHAVFRLA